MKDLPLIAIIAGGAALFLWSANLGIAANTIQVLLDGVQIKSLTNFAITLTIQNVSNATLEINSMTGTVSLNGGVIGNVSSFNQLEVPPNSERQIVVTLNPSLLSLPGVIKQIIENPTGDHQFTFLVEGNINLNSIVIPYSVQDVVNI